MVLWDKQVSLEEQRPLGENKWGQWVGKLMRGGNCRCAAPFLYFFGLVGMVHHVIS